VVVPGAGRWVRRDQSARYLRAVNAFLDEVARVQQVRTRRHSTKQALPLEVMSTVRV